MYHNFLIHSPVNGHLGCFHVSVTVNSAVMNIGVHVSFPIMVFLGYISSSRIWKSYSSSDFSFLRNLSCSPQWLYQFTFPPTVREGSLFSIPSPEFIVCTLFFDDGHSDCCEVISHYSLDLKLSNNKTHLFMCLLAILCLLWRNVYLGLPPIF